MPGWIRGALGIALLAACSLSSMSCRCSRSRQASVPEPTTPAASELPPPESAGEESIEGSDWDPDEGAGGFDVVAQFAPLTTDGDGASHSGYLGRVGEAYFFRSAAGELLAAPVLGTTRAVVAHGVPSGALLTGDARAVYWITPSCEVFTVPARRLGACSGAPDAVASDAEFVYVVTSRLSEGGVTTAVWRIPTRGGPSERLAAIETNSGVEALLVDGEHLYYSDRKTLFRLPRAGGKPAPFARENPTHRIETLQFLDQSSVFWTNREAGGREESWLVRADKRAGPSRILGRADGIVAADAGSFYWFAPTFSRLYRARRSGGHWQHLTDLPGPIVDVLPRAGGVLAMDGSRSSWIADSAPRPRQLLERKTGLDYLTEAGEHLYFVASTFDEEARRPVTELWTLPKAGGEPRRIVRAELRSAPVIDGTFAYFRGAEGRLERVPLAGGEPRPLASAAALARFPRKPELRGMDHWEPTSHHVALDDTDVFVADPERGAVLGVRKTGGPLRAIARLPDAPRALAVDAANVYVATESGLAAAANTLPRLLRVAKAGNEPPVVLAALDGDPANQLVATAAHVFWSDGRALFRVAKSGGVIETVRDAACDFAIHRDTLFFTECGAPGSVWRLRLTDGKLSAIATSLTTPRHIVADERASHWITIGTDVHPMSDTVGCCAIWTIAR